MELKSLKALVRLLRENGVNEYVTPEMTLRFGAAPAPAEPEAATPPGDGMDWDAIEDDGEPEIEPAFALEKLMKANRAP